MIFKIQHNMRINKDFNLSVSGEFIVANTDDARTAGQDMKEYVDAYLEGYKEADEDDED